MTDLLSRFTDYKNDKRKDSQIVQTIKNKNFTNKELRAGYRFGSRSILLHFFLFLFFSERFVNSINITQEMKIIFHSPQTSPIISSSLLQRCVTVVGVQCLCLWFVTLIVNLPCETCKFSSMFSVKIAISEAVKLFFWDPPQTLLQDVNKPRGI